MTTKRLSLTTPVGWCNFARSEELEAFLSRRLPLVESGGIWRYYNFTAWTSVWDSDTSPTNSVYLSYASDPAERPTRFDELRIVHSADGSEHDRQLSALLQELNSEFGLQVRNAIAGDWNA